MRLVAFALGLGLVVVVFCEAFRGRIYDYDSSSAAIGMTIPVQVKEKPLLRTKNKGYWLRQIRYQDNFDVYVDDDAQHPRQRIDSSWHRQQQGEVRGLENESETEPSLAPSSSNSSSNSSSYGSIDADATPPGLRLPWWGWLLASIGILLALPCCVLVCHFLFFYVVLGDHCFECCCCPCALLLYVCNAVQESLQERRRNRSKTIADSKPNENNNNNHERVHNTDTSNTARTLPTTTAPAEEESFSQTWLQKIQQEEKGFP